MRSVRRSEVLTGLALAVLAVVAAYGCGHKTPTQPSCSYTLSATTLTFGADGGSRTVGVTTGAACEWTATSDRDWVTIASGGTGTGPGTVDVRAAANTAASERSGTVTVAGQAVAVRQDAAAPCRIDIAPRDASFSKDSATGTFAVTADAGCSWTAVSQAAWLVVTGGSPGVGTGTVSYALDRNRELTGRTGTITVGGQTFTVSQAGDTGPAPVCEYSVAPIEFTPCMTSPVMTATVTTSGQGCSWTAEADAPWITIAGGQGGTESGTITFTVSDNWLAPRSSVIKVRWPTVTAGQNLQIRQAGCHYAVSPAAISVAAPGGTARFDVFQQSDPNNCGGATQDRCLWTAEADVPWITITSPTSRTGDNPVSFTVAPNDGASPRTGRITVRDQAVVVTQAGR